MSSNLLLALRHLDNSLTEKALRCVVALKAFLFLKLKINL